MTEDEYIAATNLSKVRAADHLIRDTLSQGPSDDEYIRIATLALRGWEARLEQEIEGSMGKHFTATQWPR